MILGPDHSISPVGVRGRDRNQPGPCVGPEYLQKVLVGPHIVDVWPRIRISLPLQVVQSRGVAQYQLHMEFEEHRYDDEEGSFDQDCDRADYEGDRYGFGLAHNLRYLTDEERDFAGKREDKGDNDVEEEQHKELAIGKTNTISDPGTMVIHIEDATLAGRAMVASISYRNYLSGLKLWHSRQ